MKLIPVLTLYMQDIYKGGLAAEPVLYCIYNMPDFYKKSKIFYEFFYIGLFVVFLCTNKSGSIQLCPSVNLSVINCRTFRRTSKQYQNLIFCKQTQNEREGHSREYPHRPIQICACHTQTVEVHMSRFHYAASQEPELSFFRIALPATAFRYQSLQCAGERTSLLLGLYIIC